MTAAKPPRNAPATSPAEVAALLRRVIAAAQDGTLDASTPQARRLVRRLELVADAFDVLAATDRKAGEGASDAGS